MRGEGAATKATKKRKLNSKHTHPKEKEAKKRKTKKDTLKPKERKKPKYLPSSLVDETGKPLSKEELSKKRKLARQIRNRLSAERSRKRRLEYISTMEEKVAKLEEEKRSLESTNASLLNRLRILEMKVEMKVEGGGLYNSSADEIDTNAHTLTTTKPSKDDDDCPQEGFLANLEVKKNGTKKGKNQNEKSENLNLATIEPY